MLKNLFKNNRELVKKINAKLLTSSLITELNSPPLCLLSQTVDGISFLLDLFQKNPELIKNIDIEDLCQVSQEDNATALQRLINADHGAPILKLLVEKNKKLKKVSGEVLCRPLNENAGKLTNSSLLWALTCNEENLAILNTWLKINPELAKGISVEGLCRPLPSYVGVFEGSSPFLWLTYQQKGLAILSRLLELNPDLAKNIGAEALCRPISQQEFPLFCLAQSQEGRSILKVLLQSNPELGKGISQESLLKKVCLESLEKKSTWDSLNESADGKELLSMMPNAPSSTQANSNSSSAVTQYASSASSSAFFTPATSSSTAATAVISSGNTSTLSSSPQ